jgi:hypothetical protein
MNKKDSKLILSSILHYFKETYSIESSGKDNIKLNKATYTPSKFVARFKKEEDEIAAFITRSEFYSIVEEVETKKKCSKDRALEVISERVFLEIKNSLDSKKKKENDLIKDTDLKNTGFNWSGHFPVIDIKTNQAIMYNSTQNKVDHMASYVVWLEYLKGLDAENRAVKRGNIVYGKVEYNPYKDEEIRTREVSGQEIPHLNAHRVPEWRETSLDKPKLPKEFKELIWHLFPKEECRNYVFHWINFMLTSRNHCYLLLHGDQGIGKNTLAAVMRSLVGQENYSYVTPSFWDDDKFNSELKHKRCVFFDETVVTPRNITNIRSFTNKHLAITEKGIDTIMYENFCSFVIANNLDKINHISFDDRRYSVPILTKEPIKNAFSQEWIDAFYHKLEEDKEFLANIGHWILQNGDKGDYNEKQPYLTDYFYDIVEKALSQWQSFIITEIEKKESSEILVEGLRELISSQVSTKATPGRVKIAGFLESHRDRDGDKYGTVVQNSAGKRVIKVHEKYCPDISFGEDQEEDLDNQDIDNIEW